MVPAGFRSHTDRRPHGWVVGGLRISTPRAANRAW